MYPWHWLIIGHDGNVFPCGHGSKSVGNLNLNSADDIWNGPTMQEIRTSLNNDSVHEVCRSTDCPHQQAHLAFTPIERPPALDEEFAKSFDEQWYLESHSDVRAAVQRRQFSSGLEHFGRHGRAEGRGYRLISQNGLNQTVAVANSALALLEYSRGATILRSRPVDLVLQVSTVCNLRCVMCPHGTGAVERPSHMPTAILDHVRDFIAVASRMIVSGLGEPLLAPAFWRLIEDCAQRDDVFVRANSNALLVTPEKARRLMVSGLTEISFSLDAATRSTYAKIRGGDFDRAIDGVRTMCAARQAHPRRSLEIFMNMTLMAENIAEAPSFVALAAELGVDAVLFSQLFPFGNDPRWQVQRPGWTFVYTEQMLNRVPIEAVKYINEARSLAATVGLRVIFQSNTDIYLEPTPALHAAAS